MWKTVDISSVFTLAVIVFRMKRNRRRQPIRSLPCRRHWKWKKSVQCQQPTSRSLRTFLCISSSWQQLLINPTVQINVPLSLSVSSFCMFFPLSLKCLCIYLSCLICVRSVPLLIHSSYYESAPVVLPWLSHPIFLTVKAIKEPSINNTC